MGVVDKCVEKEYEA